MLRLRSSTCTAGTFGARFARGLRVAFVAARWQQTRDCASVWFTKPLAMGDIRLELRCRPNLNVLCQHFEAKKTPTTSSSQRSALIDTRNNNNTDNYYCHFRPNFLISRHRLLQPSVTDWKKPSSMRFPPLINLVKCRSATFQECLRASFVRTWSSLSQDFIFLSPSAISAPAVFRGRRPHSAGTIAIWRNRGAKRSHLPNLMGVFSAVILFALCAF